MFMLVSRRYERASLIVTSNKPFSAWGEIFGDDAVAVAMVDRLIHHAAASRATALPPQRPRPRLPTGPPERRNGLTQNLRRPRRGPQTDPQRAGRPARTGENSLGRPPGRWTRRLQRRLNPTAQPGPGSILNRRYGVNSRPALTSDQGGRSITNPAYDKA
jgi:hypothetical protein